MHFYSGPPMHFLSGVRLLIGAGTPRGAAARARACLFFVYTGQAVAIILVAASRDGFAILVTVVAADPPPDQNGTSATGC